MLRREEKRATPNPKELLSNWEISSIDWCRKTVEDFYIYLKKVVPAEHYFLVVFDEARGLTNMFDIEGVSVFRNLRRAITLLPPTA